MSSEHMLSRSEAVVLIDDAKNAMSVQALEQSQKKWESQKLLITQLTNSLRTAKLIWLAKTRPTPFG